MTSTSFFDALDAQVKQKDSLLCVGLDPHSVDLAEQTGDAVVEFCTKIVEATHHVAVAYKPNIAFFEALGAPGIEALEKVTKLVQSKGIPVLLDAKRGDISSTADAYAKAAFESLGADAITVHPYMGSDSVTPFSKYQDKGVFVLCKTSNPSSNEIETLPVATELLYETVAKRCEQWNQETHNVGMVVGATDIEALARSRKAAPSVWILAPGVGFQGGDLPGTVAAGVRASDNSGLLIPVTRGISRAANMKEAAEQLRADINTARDGSKKQCTASSEGAQLKPYQRAFFDLAIACKVLAFGEFTLKSGRKSPYFFNAGNFDSGMALHKVGMYYANAIEQSGLEYDVIFGPAYKGIPLASCIGSAMYTQYGKDIPVAYNRKEAKDHGEGGKLVGASLKGKRVLVVDDVITAGTAIRESIDMISKNGGTVCGVVVALDRQEKLKIDVEMSAIQSVKKDFGIDVVTIVTLGDLLSYLKQEGKFDDAFIGKVQEYRKSYGVSA